MAASDVADVLADLVTDATEHHYSPYTRFDWADTLAERQWWMSPELLSVAGTRYAEEWDEERLMRLSKWESINFFSLNIHGIRELLIEVTRRIHTPGFELPSEFFHRFLGEENGHMWFFAQFCLRYGDRIYPDKSLPVAGSEEDTEVDHFLVFARILIFEELVDHFNLRMGRDTTLHPLIREVNQVHHDDEWRHIVMGRKLVEHLYQPLRERADEALRARLDDYLRRYITASMQSLYNPAVYRDAGVADPYVLRKELLRDPARTRYHETFFKRITKFLVNQGIISHSPFDSVTA
ncbi:diiron oxygenase [Streptomyces sp. NPDC048290]|uniref:diiron oxygenase n=1 Tax=Streptomyces sp. NPDC048290 TaxID=3155811 RepID=UPI0034376C8D